MNTTEEKPTLSVARDTLISVIRALARSVRAAPPAD